MKEYKTVKIGEFLKDSKALWDVTEEQKAFLRACGSKDPDISIPAQKALALEIGDVIQEGIFESFSVVIR